MKKIFLFLPMLLFSISLFSQSKLKRDIMEAKQALILNGYEVNGISNDSIIAIADSLQLVTQYAMKKYVDENGSFIPDGVTITAVGGAVDTSLIATQYDINGIGIDTIGDVIQGGLSKIFLSDRYVNIDTFSLEFESENGDDYPVLKINSNGDVWMNADNSAAAALSSGFLHFDYSKGSLIGGSQDVATNITSIGNNTILLGAGGSNAGSEDVVVMGGSLGTHSITGTYGYSTPDYNNSIEDAASTYSVISGGGDNHIAGLANTISGGGHNAIRGNSDHGFIGGGSLNYINTGSSYSVIVGGTDQLINSSDRSTIAGGYQNQILSTTYGFIGSGSNNTSTTGTYSTILNGSDGISSGTYSTVLNGASNTATSTYATVLGGTGNNSTGAYSLTHGFQNTGSGTRSMTFGQSNTNAGTNTAIFGRSNSVTTATVQSLVAGFNNSITGVASNCFIGGSGNANSSSGSTSMIFGDNCSITNGNINLLFGQDNTVSSASNAFVTGMDNNATGTLIFLTGKSNNGNSLYQTILGSYSIHGTGQSATSFVPTDELFKIGNGTSDVARSNALLILKNGKMTFGKYGVNTFTGVAAKYLAVESDGDVIEVPIPTSTNLYNTNGTLTANRTISSTGQSLTYSATDGNDISSAIFADNGFDFTLLDNGTSALANYIFRPEDFKVSSAELKVINTVSQQLVLTDNETNATTKNSTLSGSHYTNAEEPVTFLYSQSSSAANSLRFGGGTSTGNAATVIDFYTGANNTTTTGTRRLRIEPDGKISMGLFGTPSAILNIRGTGATSATSSILVNDSANAKKFEVKDNGEVVVYSNIVLNVASNVRVVTGAGSPEGVVTGGVGSTYHRTNGGAGTSFYVKESGTGNTGWVAK